QVGLIRYGTIGNYAGALKRRRFVNAKTDGIISFVSEQPVDVVGSLQILAVNGHDVVTYLYVDTNLGERRAIEVFLVLSLEDLGNAISARLLVELKARTWQ